MLQDIAVLTGGQVISEELGLKLESVRLADSSARAKRVVVDKDNTTIIGGGGDQGGIDGRVSSRSGARSKRRPATTTGRSCRSGSPSWPAASR